MRAKKGGSKQRYFTLKKRPSSERIHEAKQARLFKTTEKNLVAKVSGNLQRPRRDVILQVADMWLTFGFSSGGGKSKS